MLKRETILALFIGITALVIAVARPTLPAQHEPRTITVTVTGEVYSLAETAYIDVELREDDVAPENIGHALHTTGHKIEEIEIQPIDHFLTYFNMYQGYSDNELSGEYDISQTYRIIVHDLSMLDELLEGLASDTSTTNYRLYFVAPDSDELGQQALDDALLKARGIAQHFAAETGSDVGAVLKIDIGDPYHTTNPSYFNYDYAALTAGVDLDEMVVRPALIRTTVRITATFELK